MEYRLLGPTGLRVSELVLGAMTFGHPGGLGPDAAESRRIFDAYAAAGGNAIDTAINYSAGHSEAIVGDLVAAERDRFVVATKYTVTRDAADPNASGNHRKNLVHSLELSLRRLGTDYVDLYWVHIWDPNTPIDETMRALDDIVRAGKALYVGISDAPAWVVARAQTLADWRGWSPFVALQLPYSLVQREIERELLPVADAFGLSVVAWSPLAGGILSGKYGGSDAPTGTRHADAEISDRDLAIAREVQAVAADARREPVAGRDRVDDGAVRRRAPHRGGPQPRPVRGQSRSAHGRAARSCDGASRCRERDRARVPARLHGRDGTVALRRSGEAGPAAAGARAAPLAPAGGDTARVGCAAGRSRARTSHGHHIRVAHSVGTRRGGAHGDGRSRPGRDPDPHGVDGTGGGGGRRGRRGRCGVCAPG